ncbi:MAG: thiamine phosphate synthase [Deltaproteobacteria bacterium]|nr:thiamine phosphate synthase [Deltaproteobacteria bacterium]
MALPRVFVITDAGACRAGGVVLTVARMLNDVDVGGAVAVVARTKGSSIDPAALCSALLPLCRRAGALLMAHTDARLVGALGLDGVHLPSASPPRLARLQMPRGRLLGISRHAGDAFDDDDVCDYATLSPVFAPTSKPLDSRPPLGPPALSGHRRAVVALGGVDAGNARACLNHGAAGVAVVGAVLSAVDPRRALLSLMQAVGS